MKGFNLEPIQAENKENRLSDILVGFPSHGCVGELYEDLKLDCQESRVISVKQP